ncbi:unnamed protein product [Rhizophagus irregularis]|nr:unnamed protein product [Rhizophagus irregularis]
MTGKTFSSIKEELEYYKTYSIRGFRTRTRAIRKKYKELKAKNESLIRDSEEWKRKYLNAQTEANENQRQMQRELDSLRNLQEEFVVKTRDLEINCDDLERNERAATSSLLDLENKYNKAIERNVILENELEGKNSLIEQVQRLKDELKDVHIELAILKNKQDGDLGPPRPSSEPVSPPKKEIYNPPAPQPSQVSQVSTTNTGRLDQNSNTVKMVQEMVGRVKSIEARLVSCRSLVSPLLAPPPSYSTTMPLASQSPPPSPKSRVDNSFRSMKGAYRRPSIQKSKAFSMSINQMRPNAMSKVQ